MSLRRKIEQNVTDDANNSSATNLTSANSYTFTGTSTSTLGVAGLQWALSTDQNAYVYIEQSPNGTNWDISDKFDYYHNAGGSQIGDGGTVQAVSVFWRIRVVLMGTTDTTYFRLQGILCPIVEALPRALSDHGSLLVEAGIADSETDIHAKVTPFGIQKATSPVRIIGTSFSGITKDTNFWIETVTGSGAVAQSGEINLSTGATVNSTARYESSRRARHVSGAANEFKFTGRLSSALDADNIRRCGVYDDNDGFFFQVNGSTFGVGSRKGGADTIVASGNFNGNLGATVAMSTAMGNFVIWWWERTAYFFVNGKLLHTITASTASLVNTNTLPIRMETINSNGNTTDNTFEVLTASVMRFDGLETGSTYKYISSATTTICKYGAGALHSIINNDNVGSVVVYDNTAGSGTIIASIDLTKVLGTLTFMVPFNTGLTLVSTGSIKITVIYE